MRRHDATSVRERLSRAAVFTTWKTKGRGENKRSVEVEIPAPGWIAAHVIGRGTWPGYRSLLGYTTGPTLRRDGSVLQVPGYDEQSGLVYVPNAAYRPVPEEPNVRDALACRDRLLDVVSDFPLVELGRAGWLSLLFTFAARELVEGCVPMWAVDAHTAASGKGLLFRSAHVTAYGVDVPHMSLPPTDEEFRKQITTTLLRRRPGDPPRQHHGADRRRLARNAGDGADLEDTTPRQDRGLRRARPEARHRRRATAFNSSGTWGGGRSGSGSTRRTKTRRSARTSRTRNGPAKTSSSGGFGPTAPTS